MRKYLIPAFSSLLFLASCGGGGGYSSSSGGRGGGQKIAGPGPNVAAMTVEIFQPGFVNIPYITVTVCQPNTNNCANIDHVEVDTGSSGLRLMASAVPAAVLSMLPQQNAGATAFPVVECAQFADGFSWGPVVSADVTVSSEKASGIPIQIIGAPAPFNNDIPSTCSGAYPPNSEEDTVGTFGANGLIGVSDLVPDCPVCATGAVAGAYYSCPTNGSTCSSIEESVALQVSNPVASFATDKNGVIVELPSVAASGAITVTGALVFGIGTESNNGLGSATVLTADTTFGDIDATFNGADYPSSFLDSGSNANYFTDNSLSVCAMGTAGAGFFCSSANLSATLTGQNGNQLVASFTVGDATAMHEANPNAAALPQLAGPAGTNPNFSGVFDLGLPYFYGRNVFTAINGAPAGGTEGPYYAY
jgi:hypothetical protein